MRRLTYSEFQKERLKFESDVTDCDYLARFCSMLPWQSAAYEHLHGFDFGVQEPGESLIVEQDGCWLVFTERSDHVFFPFESAWMFGCPLIGDPVGAVELLETACREYLGTGFGFVISGVLRDSEFHRALLQLAERSLRYEEFATTDCLTVDLSRGIDAFLQRRSKSFRKGIRQMKVVEGLEFEDASEELPEEVFRRIFDIQARTYKAKEGADIFSDHRYERFYRNLYQRLFDIDSIRTIFAKIDDRDVAYIMGGVSQGIYRGFQMSYDNDYRKLALGNRLQLKNMSDRYDEGISLYDLGMHSEYKERWADHWDSYRGVFVVL